LPRSKRTRRAAWRPQFGAVQGDPTGASLFPGVHQHRIGTPSTAAANNLILLPNLGPDRRRWRPPRIGLFCVAEQGLRRWNEGSRPSAEAQRAITARESAEGPRHARADQLPDFLLGHCDLLRPIEGTGSSRPGMFTAANLAVNQIDPRRKSRGAGRLL
jgi:hypothetical protein